MVSQRVTRALRLTNLLNSGHIATADQLAQLLKCSRRTIFRYINLLKDSGFAVYFDQRQGGYVADVENPPPKNNLADDELVALLLAAAVSPLTRIDGFDGEVNQAIAKIMGWTGEQNRTRVNNLIRAFVFETSYPRVPEQKAPIVRAIADACSMHTQLQAFYVGDGKKKQKTSTKFSPYQLIASDDSWTVVGKSSRHRRVVSMDLTQIQSVTPIGNSYDVPLRFLQAGHTGTRQPFTSFGTSDNGEEEEEKNGARRRHAKSTAGSKPRPKSKA